MESNEDVEPISPASGKRKHNYMCCISMLVIGCTLLGTATVLIPSLVSLYLSSPDIQVTRSTANATDLWYIRYLTNLTSIDQISKRAVSSPFDKSTLGISNTFHIGVYFSFFNLHLTGFVCEIIKKIIPLSFQFSQATQVPSNTITVKTAVLITTRSRRQETTSDNDASSPVYLDVVLQALYPRECAYVVQCQKSFRERLLSKFMNLRSFSFLASLLDGNNVGLHVQLVSLTQHYEFPSTDESTTTGASNLQQSTTSSTTTTTTTTTTSTVSSTTSTSSTSTTSTTTTTTVTTTTTTVAYCAATCTGTFSSSPNTTTCSLQCVDTGSFICQSGSTFCASHNFGGSLGDCDPASGGYTGGCNTATACCVHDTFSTGHYYCLSISACGFSG